MKIDQVLQALTDHEVDYLLIGGVNFMLRHEPELTYDIDIWVADEPSNLEKVVRFLKSIDAKWGATEDNWKPVADNIDWLATQTVFCLTSPLGAVDIFREVKGLEGRFGDCKQAAEKGTTSTGVPYWPLSDQHMIEAQEALPENQQKPRRIETLKRAIKSA
ncbi:MAG: hypothetical protein H8E20_10825 [Verrucomicrobia bacterium]|nr:hypothetical protein [Verrucomicrobiota bacterium]